MKKTSLIVGLLAISMLVTGCAQQSQKNSDFYEEIPVIDAYYEGEKAWFIHTDVTSEKMAKRLTTMVNYSTIHVPKNKEAVNPDELAKIYVFTNGVDRTGVDPWGGGPFHYQIDILDTVPGDDNYTSMRNPHLVTWEDNATPRIIKSERELLEAEESGELTIKQTDVVVNVPVVRWPTDYLGGDAELENERRN